MKGVSTLRGFTGLRSPVLEDGRAGGLGLFGAVVACLLFTFVLFGEWWAGRLFSSFVCCFFYFVYVFVFRGQPRQAFRLICCCLLVYFPV